MDNYAAVPNCSSSIVHRSSGEKTVIVIPGRQTAGTQKKSCTLNVAAYCRVSTDDEEQLSSYNNQIAYYTERIRSAPDWTPAGIFADEGLSGTSARKRPEFQRLMALCKKGKVDLILTKSISRFARNTLDAVTYVRQLRAMGVGVIFDKECIDTRNMSGEMIFTVMSAFAQAESESISENVKWGKRRAAKEGRVPFQYSRMLGYRKGEDGKPEIVPEQADLVRRIYAMYLSGYSLTGIKRALEAEGIRSPSGSAEWSAGALKYVLSNERYIGDALLQKTYIEDCLSKRVIKNDGKLPQYYVENNHEGIIPRDVFARVQAEMARRAGKRKIAGKAKTGRGKYSGKYALSELTVCGECGCCYRRTTWARKGVKKVVWRCISRLEYGTKYCKHSPAIPEDILHEAVLTAMNRMAAGGAGLTAVLEESLRYALSPGDGFDRPAAERRIAELDTLMMDLVALIGKTPANAELFEDKFRAIHEERAALGAALKADELGRAGAGQAGTRLSALFEALDGAEFGLVKYDDALVRQTVENITVLALDNIVVRFIGGAEVEIPVKRPHAQGD